MTTFEFMQHLRELLADNVDMFKTVERLPTGALRLTLYTGERWLVTGWREGEGK